MPIYDFHCEACGPFVAMRAIAERDRPAPCPACGTIGARRLTAPALALLAGERRVAHATNERAAHPPAQSGQRGGRRHRPGCGRCSCAAAALPCPGGGGRL
uniref:FmdB family zinc ribbon protein n=1 Tax=Burkholderia sp. Ac-20379 TaxID=2703900 RepID=UPI0019810142